MAKIASGSNVILKRILETSFGVIPADQGSREAHKQRFSMYAPTYTKTELVDPTITGGRQDVSLTYGNHSLAMTLDSILSFADQDDLIQSGMWSTWEDVSVAQDGSERQITIGVPAVQTSFTMESEQTDINTARFFKGLTVSSFTISSPIDGNVTISYSMMGESEVKVLTALPDTVLPFSNNPPFTHINGAIEFSGAGSECIVQSFEVTVDNQATSSHCWGQKGAKGVTESNVAVTGSLTLFYINNDINDAWLDDSEESLKVTFTLNGLTFEIDMPRIRATGSENPFAPGERTITLPFRALASADGSTSAITITATGYTPTP